MWNSVDAKNWLINYYKILHSSNQLFYAQKILDQIMYFESYSSEYSFRMCLKTHSQLDDAYVEWAIKEINNI